MRLDCWLAFRARSKGYTHRQLKEPRASARQKPTRGPPECALNVHGCESVATCVHCSVASASEQTSGPSERPGPAPAEPACRTDPLLPHHLRALQKGQQGRQVTSILPRGSQTLFITAKCGNAGSAHQPVMRSQGHQSLTAEEGLKFPPVLMQDAPTHLLNDSQGHKSE